MFLNTGISIQSYVSGMFKILSKFYDKLQPSLCVICSYPTLCNLNICRACIHEMPSLTHSCQRCAQFLPSSAEVASICGACLKNNPPFDRTFTLSLYQAPISSLIIKLKYQHQLSAAKALGELMCRRIEYKWYKKEHLPDLIIPIPLHAKRLSERGFNQAIEIARPISKFLNIPIDHSGIKRIKATQSQKGLTALERKRNMFNAFSANTSYANLSVAVVDDVITTGHTMREFCAILRQQGAKRIDVWCCARRLLP